jgi:RNA polymerase sigma-70 factor, ECF subfamily
VVDAGWKQQLEGAIDGEHDRRARRLIDARVASDPGRADALLELLAARAAEGSRLAVDLLTELVDEQGVARAAVRRSLVDEAAVDDVSQETLISLARSIHSFRGESAFKTWLYQIAQKRVVDHLRRLRRTEALDREDVGEAQRISSMIATRQDVRLLIAQLPEHHRVALSLRDVEHLSYAEIAERLALPLNTVRSHIHRARAQLAARLARAGA